MKYLKKDKILIVVFFFFLNVGCNTFPVMKKPDMDQFKKKVLSVALRDSLQAQKITQGMPYFVVQEVFKEWNDDIAEKKIPVASLGSKQRMKESEGWYRKYEDPNIQIFRDEYDTEEGILNIWYQFADFYRMDVSAGDTLCIFWEDTSICSVIKYLINPRVLFLRRSFPEVPRDNNLYAHILYHDHNWRKITHWFTLQNLKDGQYFILKNLQFEIYPIELLEFNNEPITSYKWR